MDCQVVKYERLERPKSCWITPNTRPEPTPQRLPCRYEINTMGSIEASVIEPPYGSWASGMIERTVAKAIIKALSAMALVLFLVFIKVPPLKKLPHGNPVR